MSPLMNARGVWGCEKHLHFKGQRLGEGKYRAQVTPHLEAFNAGLLLETAPVWLLFVGLAERRGRDRPRPPRLRCNITPRRRRWSAAARSANVDSLGTFTPASF